MFRRRHTYLPPLPSRGSVNVGNSEPIQTAKRYGQHNEPPPSSPLPRRGLDGVGPVAAVAALERYGQHNEIREAMWRKIDDKHPSTLPKERSEASLKYPFFAFVAVWFRAYERDVNVLGWPILNYEKYVTAICAINYLKWHLLDEDHVFSVIRHFHPSSEDYAVERGNIIALGRQWESRILDDFIFPLARCLRRKILEEEGKEIRAMERYEIRTRVLDLWDERTCINMYPPCFQEHIDFPAIFRTPARFEHEVKPLRDYLEESFFLAMEDALMLRYAIVGVDVAPEHKQPDDQGAVDGWRSMLVKISKVLPELPEMRKTPVINILGDI